MITKFYIDRARYKAEDNSGNVIVVEIDYWNNRYDISNSNEELELMAKDLLKRKHRVNFAPKLIK